QSGDLVEHDAGSGNIVSGVCIKSGSNSFGDKQHSEVLDNGKYEDGCYEVSGVGTQIVTVERLGSGPDCKEISHIDVVITEDEPGTGSISGYKWNDIDGDGNVDSEPKLPGWTIFIDENDNQVLDDKESS